MRLHESRAQFDRAPEGRAGVARAPEFLRRQAATVERLDERRRDLQRTPEILGRVPEAVLAQVHVAEVVQGFGVGGVGIERAQEACARIVEQPFIQEQDAQVVVGTRVDRIEFEHALVGGHRIDAATERTERAGAREMGIDIVGPLFTGPLEAVERLPAPFGRFEHDPEVSPGFGERRALRNRAPQRDDRFVVARQRAEFVAEVVPGFGKHGLQLQRPAIGLLRGRMALELLLRESQPEPAERAAAGARHAALECLDRQCIRARLRMQVADRHPHVGLRRVHRDRLLQAGHGLFPVTAGLLEQAEQVQHPRAVRLRVEERTVGAARLVELACVVQQGRFGQRWPGAHDAAPATSCCRLPRQGLPRAARYRQEMSR